MGKYSQNNEDAEVIKYFGDKVGTFIDIGANDGITLSNSRALVELGWTGAFVEPSPTSFNRLKENYKGIDGLYFYNYALGVTNGELEFWDSETHLNQGDHGLLSTLSEDEKMRWKDQKYNKIKVECFRWRTFLNRLKIKQFDFISLDAEGLDLEILNQIDLRGTSCVCVEWNSVSGLKHEFDKLMIGFRLIYTSPENLIYAR